MIKFVNEEPKDTSGYIMQNTAKTKAEAEGLANDYNKQGFNVRVWRHSVGGIDHTGSGGFIYLIYTSLSQDYTRNR